MKKKYKNTFNEDSTKIGKTDIFFQRADEIPSSKSILDVKNFNSIYLGK